MCITSAAAHLSKTRILSCTLGEKHLLAYANSAVNLSDVPNCMILPVPGTLTKEDFIDSTPFASFMEDLESQWTPRSRTLSMSKGIEPVERFKVGMYEVFLAPGISRFDKATGLERSITERIMGKKHRVTEALNEMPEERRPIVREDLLEWFDKTYPGWSLVCCVFESDKPMASQPIMFTYTPLEEFKSKLFFPGVDSHDGGPPNLDEDVEIDHFLFVEDPGGRPTEFFRTSVPDWLREKKLVGAKFQREDTNGDWVHDTSMTRIDARTFVSLPGFFRRTKPGT